MTANQFTLSSRDDVKALVKWATAHPGVEAFPVFDYIALDVPDPSGANAIRGALNGVTVQWDVHDELVLETPEGEPNVVHPVAGGAVHVRVGGTIAAGISGFTVENPAVVHDRDPDKPKVDPALVAAFIAQMGGAK
jgi:hypothetical protein